MALARYWRVCAVDTAGRADLVMSELRLQLDGVDADAGVVPVVTVAPSAGVLASLADADTSAVVVWPRSAYASGGWAIVWDAGPGEQINANSVQLGSGASAAEFVQRLRLERSNDGVQWTAQADYAGIVWPGAHTLTVAAPYYEGGWSWTDKGSSASLVDAQTLTYSAYGGSNARATMGKSSGQWYWEITIVAATTTVNGNAISIGVWPGSRAISTYIYQTTGVRRIYQAMAVGDVFGVAFDASAGICNIYRNGALVGPVTGSPMAISEAWYPVAGDDNFANAQIRINVGGQPLVHTPPAGYVPIGYAGSGPARAAAPLRMGRLSAALGAALGSAAPGFSMSHVRALGARDVEFGGLGSIVGTVEIDGTPATPARRRVRLHRDRDGLLAREAWSDAETGAFAFHGLSTGQTFTALAHDHTGALEAVAAANRVPEVLPS